MIFRFYIFIVYYNSNNKLSVEIGQRIRSYRSQSGISQEELAEKCGLHPTYIGQVERGEKNATLESISKIANGLNLSLSKLFENISSDEDNENYPAEAYDLVLFLPVDEQEKLLKIIKMIIQMK